MNKRIHTKHDWNLLPHYVQSIVATSKIVSGPAPFQIFPSWLGKNSKRLKHRRYLDNLSSKVKCSNDEMRLDYVDPIQQIILYPLMNDKPDIKAVIKNMELLRLTRDEMIDNLQEVLFERIELPTKVKTAFTREYNKLYPDRKVGKTVKKLSVDDEDDEDNEDNEGNEDNEYLEA
jgi:hypothetical protein